MLQLATLHLSNAFSPSFLCLLRNALVLVHCGPSLPWPFVAEGLPVGARPDRGWERLARKRHGGQRRCGGAAS